MHGLDNDFIVFDARGEPLKLAASQARAIAGREHGVGCDQILIIEPPRSGDEDADAFMRILNADGGEVDACGNGTRCVALLIMAETGKDHALIETNSGLMEARNADDGLIRVDMGRPRLDWRDIPLSRACDTLHLPLDIGPFSDPVGVSMGNPHAVFFVNDAKAAPLDVHGATIERHALFPQFANVGAAQVMSKTKIRLRVWERGAGLTKACGTGACAALVAASRRGLTGRTATIKLDGGDLLIEWLADDHVLMTGPAALDFEGVLDLDAATMARDKS